jgi:hypothetical protein
MKRAFVPLHVRRIWRAFFILLALIAMATTTVLAAAQPVTGSYTGRVIGREVTFERKGKRVNDWAGVLNLQLDSGENIPVFCIEVDVLVRPGDRYHSDGPVQVLPNGCKIRYLLDKYPASSAKTADEAAARQMALWVFSDGIDLTTITDTTTLVRDRATALVNEAQRAPCPPSPAAIPDLTLEPPIASAAAGQTVSYTVRAGAASAGQQVSVAVSGPALLANGQQQASVPLDAQGNAVFAVTSTGAGSTAVSAKLPYQLQAGTIFSHIDDSRKTQRLVSAAKQTLTAQATSQINWAVSAPSATPTLSPTPRPQSKPHEHPTETAQPTPEATATAVGEQTATPEATIAQATTTPEVATPQTAGSAGSQQPRSLPRTGAADAPRWLIVGLAALLCVCGWRLQRRARQ